MFKKVLLLSGVVFVTSSAFCMQDEPFKGAQAKSSVFEEIILENQKDKDSAISVGFYKFASAKMGSLRFSEGCKLFRNEIGMNAQIAAYKLNYDIRSLVKNKDADWLKFEQSIGLKTTDKATTSLLFDFLESQREFFTNNKQKIQEVVLAESFKKTIFETDRMSNLSKGFVEIEGEWYVPESVVVSTLREKAQSFASSIIQTIE